MKLIETLEQVREAITSSEIAIYYRDKHKPDTEEPVPFYINKTFESIKIYPNHITVIIKYFNDRELYYITKEEYYQEKQEL